MAIKVNYHNFMELKLKFKGYWLEGSKVDSKVDSKEGNMEVN